MIEKQLINLLLDKDYVVAYRKYYMGAKAYFAKWERGVSAPEWWTQ